MRWQLDRKAAALTRRAPQQDSTAVPFDNMLNDAQADADTLSLAPQLRTEAIKPFEYFFMPVGRAERV